MSTLTIPRLNPYSRVSPKSIIAVVWWIITELTEKVSVVVLALLTFTMWADVFTTIVTVSSGTQEQSPVGAFVIEHLGFVGLVLFMAILVMANLGMYFLTGHNSWIVRGAQWVGNLFSSSIGVFLGWAASFSGWVLRLVLLYCWVDTIMYDWYVFTNPVVSPDAIPQIQQTIRILAGFVGIFY